ncbi:HAD family hydrolase [Novosphingobium sp. B 225]|uniref:HAD family hydrolase n=1 Tax=Novosphingobium sp. B 225 TaxID=1961849 RepID=UPI000B4ACD38|nr:HAD-IA family hydrolase [Novosphingobium sp. B 225]
MGLIDVAIVGFDLDGTLVDSSGDLANATNAVLAAIGRSSLTRDQVLPFIGLGPRHMLEQALLATGGVPAGRFDDLFAQLLDHYENNIAEETRLYPDARELLSLLARQGRQFGVVTNKLEHLATRLLGELAILEGMHFVIGGDTLGPGNAKPSGQPIFEMIERCGGGSALFVGDSIHDMKAARNAGVPGVLLRHGRSDAELREIEADLVIEDLTALRQEFELAGRR